MTNSPISTPVAINRGKRLVVFDDDYVSNIDIFFDDDGLETREPSEAVVCIAQDSSRLWHAIDLSQFEAISPN